MENTKEEEEEH